MSHTYAITDLRRARERIWSASSVSTNLTVVKELNRIVIELDEIIAFLEHEDRAQTKLT